MDENLLSIGKIINFHGIQGEVKVGYTPGKEKQIEQLKSVIIEQGPELRTLEIKTIRFHKKFALIKFKGINSLDEAAELKGAFLKADKEKIKNFLEEDEFLISDLKGLDAYDTEGNFVGKISSVLDQGGGNTLCIKSKDNKQHLIPFVKELVPEVNIKEEKIIINAIPGLIE